MEKSNAIRELKREMINDDTESLNEISLAYCKKLDSLGKRARLIAEDFEEALSSRETARRSRSRNN